MRQAADADAAYVTELLALAFHHDPTWSWAFPDPATRLDGHRELWGLYVRTAVARGCAWMTDDGSAAAVWVPPGHPELGEEDEARVESLLRQRLGSHADDVLSLIDSFEANHPEDPPHYYLSLLGTHPDHRGQGRGMGLLRANLERFDAQGTPCYLESSNRANDRRYAQLGFAQIAEFAAPGGEPTVACMWRDAGSGVEAGRRL